MFFTCLLLNIIPMILQSPGHKILYFWVQYGRYERADFFLRIWLFWNFFCPITISLLLWRWTFSRITLKNDQAYQAEFCSIHTTRYSSVFGHFSTLCMKGLKSHMLLCYKRLPSINPWVTNVLHHSQLICNVNQLTGFYMMGNIGR